MKAPAHPIESVLSTWRRGAVVTIQERGAEATHRPAAFVFMDGADAVMWVEPAYADPWGSASSAFHRREGVIRASDDGLEFEMQTGGQLLIKPYSTRDQALVGDALEWFSRWLAEECKAWHLERNRVKKLCK